MNDIFNVVFLLLINQHFCYLLYICIENLLDTKTQSSTFSLGQTKWRKTPFCFFAEWCIAGGCFPRIADHLVFFSALFLTRWVDLGTAGLFVPLCGKVFYCHLETIAIPWGKLSVEEGFRLPSIFYDFKFLSSFKGGGSDDLGWACECLLMTERRCTRLSAQSEKSLLSTTLILHSRFEWEKQLTLATYSSKHDDFIGFLTVKLL